MPTFDIYIRQSGDETEASPELQEAACREYASTHGWEIDEVVVESNTSSIAPADERGLGFLVRRCESGESNGIVCRHLDRFGRSVGEGSLALKRIKDAGARLVATADGIDSSRDGSSFQITMMLAFAEQTYDRNRGWFLSGKERAVAKGVYAAIAPFGYSRDEEGRLQPNDDAETVKEIFRLRAEGIGFSEIERRIDHKLTRSGVRRVVMNGAYCGEQRIPDPDRKGEPRVIRDSHVPLITDAQWEAANAVKYPAPIRRGLSEAVVLKGLVRCGVCGRMLSVLSYGKNREKLTYACTHRGCGAVSMAVVKVEPAALAMIHRAVVADEPHVVATLADDDRYERALDAVARARGAEAEYRDSIEAQRVLGIHDYTLGLRTRRQAVEVARRALRETPRPNVGLAFPEHEFDPANLAAESLEYEANLARRVVAEIRVYPQRAATHRMTLRWRGSDEHVPVGGDVEVADERRPANSLRRRTA